MFDTPLLSCDGLNSCKNIYVSSDESGSNSIEELYAKGMFSLQTSEIYSNADISNDYYFYGFYSGYGTSIFCQANHVCSVTCKNNGCKGLTIFFDDSSSLTIDCDESNGHLCPNMDYSSNCDSNGLDLLNLFDIYYMREYDLADVYDDNSFECNTNSDYDSCNNYQDSNCYSTTLSVFQDKNLCCRGVYSCKYSSISVESGSNTRCMGSQSCSYGSISGPTDSSIGSNGATLECGRDACQYSQVSNIDNVVSVGYRGLEGTSVSDSEFLGCFTTEGCFESELSDIKYIYGTGYQSLLSANIDNSNLDRFEVYLLGYDSGNDLDITCDNSILQECVIYCYNEETCNNLGTIDCNCQTVILNDGTTCTGICKCFFVFFNFLYVIILAFLHAVTYLYLYIYIYR